MGGTFRRRHQLHLMPSYQLQARPAENGRKIGEKTRNFFITNESRKTDDRREYF